MKRNIKFSKVNKVVSIIDYRDKMTLGEMDHPVNRDLNKMLKTIDGEEKKDDEVLLADATEEYLSYEKKRWDNKFLTVLSLITSAFIGSSILAANEYGLGTLILTVPVNIQLIYTTLYSFKGRLKAEQGLKKLKEIITDLKKEKEEGKSL